MTTININESKLSIIKLDFTKGDTKICGLPKSEMKYQRVILTSPSDSSIYVLPAPTPDIDVPAVCKRAGYSEAWIITEGKTRHSGNKYTGIEKDVMLKWVKELYPAHLDTAEILVRTVDYGNVIRKFYESYGTDLIRDFYLLIDQIIDGVVKGTGKSDKKFAKTYIRPRYGIFEFLQDIMEAGDVKIYTDPDLIGQYKRISRGLKFTGKIVPDKWCDVIGIIGNRTRANLSISYMSDVIVNVPENTHGATPGDRTLKSNKSFCVVKDGVVWGKWMGIKTKNQTLVKKMRSSGMIKSGILYDDEYLINLESIPVISYKETRHITSRLLAWREAEVELAKIGLAWARRMKHMEDKKLKVCPKSIDVEVSEEEKYLRTLGIYGDTYVPSGEVADTTRSYESYEVIGHVSSLPSDYGLTAMKYINGGTLSSDCAKAFLDHVSDLHVKNSRTWGTEVAMWEREVSKRIKDLREIKFRFILGKTLKFTDTKGKKVENVRVKLPLDESHNLTVYWTMCKTRYEI